ncbi:MAG: DUF4492 domain-containing protein [Bacteroidaceae bacterium]
MKKAIFSLYVDGFRSMPRWACIVWIIILLKIVVFFGIIRPLFFPNMLQQTYKTDAQRSEHVIRQITTTNPSSLTP